MKHFENQPFGIQAWIKYRSLDQRYIMSKLKIEETFFENLHAKPKVQKHDELRLTDVTEEDTKVKPEDFKM